MGRGAGGSATTSAGRHGGDRGLIRALAVVSRVERRMAGHAPERRGFVLRGSRANAMHRSLDGPWIDCAANAQDAPSAATIVARSSADVVTAARVRVGRLPPQLRLRAFYQEQWPPSTLVAHRRLVGAQRRVPRAVRSLRSLEGTADFEIPRVHAHGSVRGFDYALESLIEGVHAQDRTHKATLVKKLLPKLFATYEAVGIESRPLGEAFPARRIEPRMRALVAGHATKEWPRWTERLDDLFRRLDPDWTVPVSLVHGDLVFSNIMETPAGDIALIDWELSDRLPLAYDVAKLAAVGPHPEEHADELVQHLAEVRLPGQAPVRMQVVAGLLRYLSWWPERLERSTVVGRERAFHRHLSRQLKCIDALLALERR